MQSIDLKKLVRSSSILHHLEVDYTMHGQVFLYISDSPNRAIIVYDVLNKSGHRVQLPTFVKSGSDENDILYINLINKTSENPRLYFSYFNSNRVFCIDAKNLREGISKNVISIVGTKSNQIVFLGTNNGCSLFFRNAGMFTALKIFFSFILYDKFLNFHLMFFFFFFR